MSPLPGVLVVIGTRPEAIKLAPVVAALRERSDEVRTRVAFTGQHAELVDQAIAAFDLDPDHDLGIMKADQTLYDVAHGCLDGLREVLGEDDPDAVVVQGDTATVFFASLVGFFERILVAHVEAGLRSGEKWSPYPEEILRRLTDVVSDIHLAPTAAARENLLREGVSPERVHVTGNTVVDALLAIAGRGGEPDDPVLRRIVGGERRLVLLTAHRRESFGEPIREVFRGVREVAEGHPDVEVLYPVHPNPNVTGPAAELLSGHPRIHLVEPLHYLDLVRALSRATLVLTDSGGIQEEAPTFGVPVLVLREVTERPEGIEAGVARLVGTDRERIVAEAGKYLDRAEARARVEEAQNPYGDGRAGERIADVLAARLTGRERRTRDWEGR